MKKMEFKLTVNDVVDFQVKKELITDLFGPNEIVDMSTSVFEPCEGNKVFELKNFNQHKWIRFYEVNGEPFIEFQGGCIYSGEKGLNEFEEKVIYKYMDERYVEDIGIKIGRKYLAGAELLRIACDLPSRDSLEIEQIEFNSFSEAILAAMPNIENYLENNEENPFIEKNRKWFKIASKIKDRDVLYLYEDKNEDNPSYYDLVCLKIELLDEFFNLAIPLPVLSEATGYTQLELYRFLDDSDNASVWNSRYEESFI